MNDHLKILRLLGLYIDDIVYTNQITSEPEQVSDVIELVQSPDGSYGEPPNQQPYLLKDK